MTVVGLAIMVLQVGLCNKIRLVWFNDGLCEVKMVLNLKIMIMIIKKKKEYVQSQVRR